MLRYPLFSVIHDFIKNKRVDHLQVPRERFRFHNEEIKQLVNGADEVMVIAVREDRRG